MLAVDAEAGSSLRPLCPLCPLFNQARDPRGQLLLDGTMGRIGRMGRMIMGQGDCFVGDNGTMGQHHTPCKLRLPALATGH